MDVHNSHATKSISVCGHVVSVNLLSSTVSLQEFRSRQNDVFPNVVCDYRAPDTCNPNNQPVPCCQRPEVIGSGAMVVSSLLLMAAMSFVTLLL